MRWILTFAALGALAGTLAAQSVPPLARGARVRLRPRAPAGFFDREIEGTLEQLSGDTITLRPRGGGQSQVFAGEVCTGNEALCVNRRQVTLTSEVALAAIGAATGLIIGAFNPRDTWKRTPLSPSARIGVSMGTGTVGVRVTLAR
jgi:hypothetical protein